MQRLPTAICLAAVACARHESLAARALASLAAQPPLPVAISPDGSRALSKRLHPASVELLVSDRASQRTLASVRIDDASVPAAAFRADSGAIAFFADHAGDASWRLYLLDVASRRRTEAAGPATLSPQLAWAPKGAKIAYLEAQRGRRGRRLWVLEEGRPARALADGIAPRTGIAWDAGGVRLAAVADDGLLVVDAVSGEVRRLEPRIGTIRSVAFAPDGSALDVAARPPNAEWFQLWRVAFDDSRARLLVSEEGDVADPAPLEGRIAYHLVRDGEVQLRVRDAAGSLQATVGDAGVSTLLAAAGGFAWISRAPPSGPPEVARIDLASAGVTPLGSAARVWIPAFDGRRIPLSIQRGRPGSARRMAVVRVHGGPALQTLAEWDAGTQLLNDAGIDVISVDYRGSTGAGASWEDAPGGEEARVADVVAARDHAIRVLGDGRVVFFGISYGALLAAEAAARGRDADAVLVSIAGAPLRPPQAVGQRVIAFHGAADRVSPSARAPAILRAALGAPPSRFTVLEREGHVFHRLESWAAVYAAILELQERP